MITRTSYLKQKELKTSDCKDITLFPKDLLHFQLSFEKSIFNPWFYCHFINIYYLSLGFMDYVDETNFREIIDIQNIGFEEYVSVNNRACFCKAISHGAFVYSWVDNFLIPTSPYFSQIHDIHPILVYGFDKIKKLYYCSRFSIQKGLEKTIIPMKDVHLAVESAKTYFFCPTEIPFKFLKARDIRKGYKNSAGRFISELKQYLLGKGNRDYSYYVNRQPVELNKEFFGIQITKCFIDGLKTPSLYELFDYRLLHMIVENKSHILDSMLYHSSLLHFSEEMDSVIEKYRRLVIKYQQMRRLYIKQSYIESNHVSFYRPPENVAIIERMTATIEELMANEVKVLNEFIPLMEKKLINDRQIVNGTPFVEAVITKQVDLSSKRSCIEYMFEKPVDIGIVEIYSPNESFEGMLYVDDYSFECHDRESEYSFLAIDVGIDKVKSIKYYPERLVISNGTPEINLSFYKQNMARRAKIEVSSVFSELPGFSFEPENVLTSPNSGTDWTPEQSDKNRWLKMKFRDPISIDTIVICQNENEQRILDYTVQATDIFGNQRCIIENPGEIGAQPAFHKMALSDILTLKFTITKTKMDNNGYDVPRITNIGVY